MTNQPEKFDLRSHDIAAEKQAALRAALHNLQSSMPEIFTEGGKIDFERLKLALGETIDSGKERYGMNWPGKADCFKTIQQPSMATLVPVKSESESWDTTENLIIEGDNLEVLKLLQKSYLGRVKMIYIDPPYNTGNDFIYPDNYAESLDTYLRYTGQVDSEGRKYSTNTEADGRFHSKWLNMMYPRLYLARNLLREDGVIFISIDDAEADNLRKLCNEIFGEENFVAQLVWEKGRKNDAKFFSVGHEYLLVFAKSLGSLREAKTVWREQKPGAKEIWEEYVRLREKRGANDRLIEADLQSWFQGLPKSHPSKKLSRYKRVDANGPWRDRDISWPGDGPHKYPIIHPITQQPCKVPESGWRFAEEEMKRQIRLGLVEFRADHTEPPFRKAHIKPVVEELALESPDDEEDGEEDEEMATQVRGSYLYKQSQVAVKYLKKLMGAKVFNNPKDHVELLRFIRYVTANDTDAIVLEGVKKVQSELIASESASHERTGSNINESFGMGGFGLVIFG
ncbi:MAG: site-specific DNA-methyltransferase, partial [Terrimicrobiaceae bacterium]|nr:site-specific DNA-methyltransferase [Terrimicrobiaceae bacterium]